MKTRPVADGWARAVMPKLAAIQKCHGLTYRLKQKGEELNCISSTKKAKLGNDDC